MALTTNEELLVKEIILAKQKEIQEEAINAAAFAQISDLRTQIIAIEDKRIRDIQELYKK